MKWRMKISFLWTSRELEISCRLNQPLKTEVAKGKGDSEILEWISAEMPIKRTAWEIAAWTNYQNSRGPTDFESREFFNGLLGALSKTRADIVTWADLLDLDDYVTFGGKA